MAEGPCGQQRLLSSVEARQQPLDHALLKMHLNYFLGDDSGIFEDHRKDR